MAADREELRKIVQDGYRLALRGEALAWRCAVSCTAALAAALLLDGRGWGPLLFLAALGTSAMTVSAARGTQEMQTLARRAAATLAEASGRSCRDLERAARAVWGHWPP